LAISDAEMFLIPKYQLAAEHFFKHGPLLWNPWEFGGIPMLATSYSGSTYPLAWLSYGLLEFDDAHILFLALHLGIGAVSAFLLARALGCSLWPALLAGIWVANPYILTRGFLNPAHLSGAMWIPVLILLTRGLILRPSARLAALLALTATMLVTSGYLPYVLLIGFVCLIGLPTWLWEARAKIGRIPLRQIVAACLLAGICTAAVSAVHLLPVAELIPLSNRADMVESSALNQDWLLSNRTMWRMPGLPPPTVGVGLLELWSNFGPGLLALILIGAVLASWGPSGWHFLVLATFGSIVPLGIIKSLPLIEVVRFGLEWTWLGLFAIYLLAALGLQAASQRWRLSPTTVAILMAVATSSSIASSAAELRALGLWQVDQTQPLDLAPLYEAGCVQEESATRVLWPAATRRGLLLRHHISSIGGYEQSMLPARIAAVHAELEIPVFFPLMGWTRLVAQHPSIFARMGLGCIATHRRAPLLVEAGFRLASGSPREPWVYTWDRALPRARLVFDVVSVSSPEEALSLVLSENLDPMRTIVLESPSIEIESCDRSDESHVVIDRSEPEELDVHVRSPCQAYLVISDTWMPGWRAWLDGREVPIHVSDYLFRAVRVDAGDHEVRFRYQPRAYGIGKWLSLAGLMVCFGLIVLSRDHDPLVRSMGTLVSRE
jgi:hypothetical protein